MPGGNSTTVSAWFQHDNIPAWYDTRRRQWIFLAE
jgi:hypothetical protein